MILLPSARITSVSSTFLNNTKTTRLFSSTSCTEYLASNLTNASQKLRRQCSSTAYDMQPILPLLSSDSLRLPSSSPSNTADAKGLSQPSYKVLGYLSANSDKKKRHNLLARLMPEISRSLLARRFSTTLRRDLKLVQFVYNADPSNMRVGFMTNNGVTDANILDATLPDNMLSILREGLVCKLYEIYCQQSGYGCIPCNCVTLKAPITDMDKILCVGLNYKDHCTTHKLEQPKVPMIFSKFSSTIIGPTDAIRIRTFITKKVDWEVELCVVIGETACCVMAEDAMNYVMGCTVAQDLTARDWTPKEMNLGQLILGKSMDTFCPIGPWITTTDEIMDIDNLKIQCYLNGCVKQESTTGEMIYKIPFLIERISSVMTLYPGDLILTGTPAGVGQYSDPPEFLQPGDVLTSAVECVGVMSNHVLDF